MIVLERGNVPCNYRDFCSGPYWFSLQPLAKPFGARGWPSDQSIPALNRLGRCVICCCKQALRVCFLRAGWRMQSIEDWEQENCLDKRSKIFLLKPQSNCINGCFIFISSKKLRENAHLYTGWWFQSTQLKNISQNGFIFPKWMRKKKYLKTSTQYTFPSPLEGQTSSHRAQKQAKEQRAPRWRFFQMDVRSQWGTQIWKLGWGIKNVRWMYLKLKLTAKAPKNGGFQYESPFPVVYFQGLC